MQPRAGQRALNRNPTLFQPTGIFFIEIWEINGLFGGKNL
jgi:hypothetical protein